MNAESSKHLGEIIAIVAATMLLGAFIYSINEIVSPFILAGAVLFLLYPFRQSKLASRLIWLTVLLFALWFVYSLRGVLFPFVIALLVAYLMNPLVTRLERRMSRWVSSLLFVLLLVGMMVSVLVFVVPIAFGQFEQILGRLADMAATVSDYLESGEIFNLLARFGVPVDEARAFIANELSPRLEGVLQAIFRGVFGFITEFSSFVMQLLNAIIIPFLIFYLLMDFPLLVQRFKGYLSYLHPVWLELVTHKVDLVIGKYLRGAIIVAAIQGLIAGTVLWMIGVKYALMLGIMTALLNFIPYIGLLTSLVVASFVATLSGEPVTGKVIGVVALYLSQKLLEATVLAPKIIGTEVGLHPVLLILCLLVFGYFLGFIGLLIAVPATALIVTGINEWEARRRPAVSTAEDE